MAKQLVLTVDGKEDQLPEGLEVNGTFVRRGITNPAVIRENGRYLIFARLIYEDRMGLNSAILRYEATKRDGRIGVLDGTERTVFAPAQKIRNAEDHLGHRGIEDFRLASVQGENVVHGFLVYHDGMNARTEYVRTGVDPQDYSTWHKHGIWFPNIRIQQALALVSNEAYRNRWHQDHGRLLIEEKRLRKEEVHNNPFLGTKDCSLWPRKVWEEGEEQYGIPIRLLPDIQMVYVKDFKELARKKFWKKIIKNIDKYVLMRRKYAWEASHIGIAGQPVEIAEGTLMFYHGAVKEPKKRYVLGASLRDSKNPRIELARTPRPIIEPTEDYEMESGVIKHAGVVFHTTHLLSLDGRVIEHFYGGSDRNVCYDEGRVEDILADMEFARGV